MTTQKEQAECIELFERQMKANGYSITKSEDGYWKPAVELMWCGFELGWKAARPSQAAAVGGDDLPLLKVRLDKPAKAGAAVFGAGVKTQLLVDHCQRQYAYAQELPDDQQYVDRLREMFGTAQPRPVEPVPFGFAHKDCKLGDGKNTRAVIACERIDDFTVPLYAEPVRPVEPVAEVVMRNNQPVGVPFLRDGKWSISSGQMLYAAPQPGADTAQRRDAKDAARYRWLRAVNADENHKLCIYELGGDLPENLDSYIDAALAQPATPADIKQNAPAKHEGGGDE